MIIGLTGSFCSGKDSVADYLIKKGFTHYSLSDAIREEADNRGIKRTRVNLQRLGNELRAKHGPAVLAKKAMEKVRPGQNYILSSIRALEEARFLKQNRNFFLINVDAPVKIRFERMAARRREEDPATLKEFKAKERFEQSKDKHGMQVKQCQKAADITLINDSGFEELYEKIDKIINDLHLAVIKRDRPSKDWYYVNIAKEVSQRATCLSVKTGAVIVKNDQVIATGYVGAPRTTLSCLERGECLRRKLKIPSGQRYELCRSVHAEMNAIINAARAGASILDADMFLYGIRIHQGEYELFDMFPCFICKKQIVNAGIRRVVCIKADNTLKEFWVKDWVKEWQKSDMLEDKYKYDAKYYREKA